MSASRDDEKRNAARRAAAMVEDGMRVGLGSGSTSAHAVRAIGERVKDGLRIEAVATSSATQALAQALGIPIVPLGETPLDLAIDGADEVDATLRMIKGGGGALLREKIVAHAARRFVVAVDASKQVATLGAFPLPLEVLPFALGFVMRTLRDAGRAPRLRVDATGDPVITDQGNHLVDCALGAIDDPEALARALSEIPGVVEHGLFLVEAHVLVVGRGDTVELVPRPV